MSEIALSAAEYNALSALVSSVRRFLASAAPSEERKAMRSALVDLDIAVAKANNARF